MKILCILNISNADDLMCDSGIIFQRILITEFANKGIDYHVIGPNIESFRQYNLGLAKKYYIKLGTTRYSSRFHFDWYSIKSIIEETSPDIIFNNQVEISSAIKSILVENNNTKTKIITYCHYPALWPSDKEIPNLDGSLNHSNLGFPIIFNIISSLLTSDAFVIQSNFAKNLVIDMASHYRIDEYKDIIVIPPPVDPLVSLVKDIPSLIQGKNILYNHRLYNTYGTEDFLSFIEECSDLNFNLIVSDPMPKRSTKRSILNSTPSFFREEISKLNNAKLIDGNVNREEYKKIISTCRLSFAAFRKACVWSMASIDCMSLGVPVIAPNYAAYPEFIPQTLLFNNQNEARQLMKLLLENDNFWIESSKESIKKLDELSVSKISDKFLNIFKSLY